MVSRSGPLRFPAGIDLGTQTGQLLPLVALTPASTLALILLASVSVRVVCVPMGAACVSGIVWEEGAFGDYEETEGKKLFQV